MKFIMILTVIFNGQASVTTAVFDDYDACNAAGRAFMQRSAKRLDILWECSPTSSERKG